MGFSLILPFFPKEAEAKGVEPGFLGMILAIYELTILVLTPFVPSLIVQFGSRRLLVAGNLLGGLANVLLSCCWSLNTPVLFTAAGLLLRMLAGCACASYTVTAVSLLPALYGPQLSTAAGGLEAANGLGFISGPVVGSLLFSLGGGAAHVGYVMPFLVLGCVELAFAAVNARLLPTMPSAPRQQPRFLGAFSWKVLVPLCHSVVTSFGFNVMHPTLSYHLTKPPLEFPVETVGLIFAVACVSFTLFTPLVGFLDDTWDLGWRLMPSGTFISGLSFATFAPAPIGVGDVHLTLTRLSTVLCMIGFGVGMAASLIPIYKQVLKCARHDASEEREVTSGALFNMGLSVGGVVGPLIAGAWSQAVGIRDCYLQFGAFLMAWSSLVYCSSLFPAIGDSTDGSAAAAALSKQPQYGTV